MEAHVWQQLEGLSVEPHVVQDLRVVHVVGQLSRRREVAEGDHLLGAVDDHRLVNVGTSRLGLLLQRQSIKQGESRTQLLSERKEERKRDHITTRYIFFNITRYSLPPCGEMYIRIYSPGRVEADEQS